MAEKTILVTGGAGYVGSHVCKALARAGYEPITYDNLIRGHRALVKWGPLVIGDVCDTHGVADTIAHYKPAAVMHFAALTVVGESVAYPEGYLRTNIGGTAAVLSAMKKQGVAKIIVSGTAAVYSTAAPSPITEDAPIAPANPYGDSKLAMERLLGESGLRHVILRYFNAAGADPDTETGEWHEPETHLVPNVLRAAAGIGPALKMFGDDYPTPDGTCLRDYIHVNDIAAAHLAALKHLETHAGGHIFNLGTGTGHSVREVIETARRVTGRQIPVTVEPRRPGDVPVLVADPSRAKKALGWEARASLEQQVTDAWRWVQKTQA